MGEAGLFLAGDRSHDLGEGLHLPLLLPFTFFHAVELFLELFKLGLELLLLCPFEIELVRDKHPVLVHLADINLALSRLFFSGNPV